MTLGSIDYMIRDVDYARLLNRLTKEKMIYSDLHEENGCLKITISFEHSFRFEKMCHLEGYKPCKTAIHGMLRFYKSLYTRPGLIFGALLSALLMVYYSNVILTLQVVFSRDCNYLLQSLWINSIIFIRKSFFQPVIHHLSSP